MKDFRTIRQELAAIGIVQNKSTDGHWADYEREFPALRSRVRAILEIGVYQGAALAALAEYFPEASLLGLDIADALTPQFLAWRERQNGRVRVEVGAGIPDEPTPEFRRFAEACGPFDLILDDGAHTYATARTAFDAFYERLSPGGLYIIEDWGVTFRQDWADGSADGSAGMLRLIPYLCRRMAAPAEYLRSTIASVQVNSWQIWIRKKS